MSYFETGIIFLCITTAFAYINRRFIGLPSTIGVMVISLVISLLLVLLDTLGLTQLHEYGVKLIEKVDFHTLLMDVMLSMLLFAGALHVRTDDLRSQKWWVVILAVFGTLLSTVIVAGLTYYVMPFLNIQLPLIWCLLFGALISPTDPIAVMGILKSAGAPKSINTVIAGESLFNDGIGVVLFTLFLGILMSGQVPDLPEVGMMLLHEAGGGIAFGLALGVIGYFLLKSIDSYHEEVLITLALVLGGYSLANYWGLSGPLAMVIAGLLMGNQARARAMSENTRRYIDLFWELIDEILNALLFVLLGLEIIMVTFNMNIIVASMVAIVIALLARLLVVGATTKLMRKNLRLPINAWQVLTWGGLRGGISVALVLSLPSGEERNLLLALTYAIVVFSILVQGLSIGKVTRHIVQPKTIPDEI